jgi:hypothetical protein
MLFGDIHLIWPTRSSLHFLSLAIQESNPDFPKLALQMTHILNS